MKQSIPYYLVFCMLISLCSLSLYANENKDSKASSNRETTLLACDSLIIWAEHEQPQMPHTKKYISNLMLRADIKDIKSADELFRIAELFSNVDYLSGIVEEAKIFRKSVYIAAEAYETVNKIYNRDAIERMKNEIVKIPTSSLTYQQINDVEDLRSQLDLYYLATSNFLQVIEDIENAKDNPKTFSNQIKEDVIDFENRNKNINRIPYMKKMYEDLIKYLHQQNDHSFVIDEIEWDKIEKLKIEITNCRKK